MLARGGGGRPSESPRPHRPEEPPPRGPPARQTCPRSPSQRPRRGEPPGGRPAPLPFPALQPPARRGAGRVYFQRFWPVAEHLGVLNHVPLGNAGCLSGADECHLSTFFHGRSPLPAACPRCNRPRPLLLPGWGLPGPSEGAFCVQLSTSEKSDLLFLLRRPEVVPALSGWHAEVQAWSAWTVGSGVGPASSAELSGAFRARSSPMALASLALRRTPHAAVAF